MLRAAEIPVKGEPALGRTDVVREPDVHEGRAAHQRPEVDNVEVGHRLRDQRPGVGVEPEVLIYLLVRVRVGESGRVDEGSQIRGPGHGTAHGVGGQRGQHDGEGAPLTAAVDTNAVDVHLGEGGQYVDRPQGIQVEAPVRVRLLVDDVLDQQAGIAGVE